jgi:hypothetical protein
VGFSYSYTRVNPDGILSGANADGGYGYVEYNFNKVLGLVADLGANHAGNAGGVQLGNTTFEYLFGPWFNWRKSRFTPYVQVLVGGQRFSNGLDPSSTTPRLASAQNNFAAAIGGGVDFNRTSHDHGEADSIGVPGGAGFTGRRKPELRSEQPPLFRGRGLPFRLEVNKR